VKSVGNTFASINIIQQKAAVRLACEEKGGPHAHVQRPITPRTELESRQYRRILNQRGKMSSSLIWVVLILLFALAIALAKRFLTLAITQEVMFIIGIGVLALGLVIFLVKPKP
jgi:uncharacterized membrane protein (DUF485 family)